MEKKTYEIVQEQEGQVVSWFARVVGGDYVEGTLTRLGPDGCKALLIRKLGKTETIVEEVEL